MKFVLATQNMKKLEELKKVLSDLGVEVVSEAELGVKVEVEETGETFAENSLLKAKAVMEATGLPAIADDSGPCVNALNGGPGVYSARFGGEGLDDRGRYMLLLQMMQGQTDRSACFHTTVTCAFPATFCARTAIATAPLRMRRWATTALAITPYSSYLTSERPLHR